MAKVYDALKQVEAERTRQIRGEAPWPRAVADERVRERVETVLDRLEVLEQIVVRRVPEMQRGLQRELEDRIEAANRELVSVVATLREQTRHDLAALNRRLSVLLAAVAVLLVAVLIRL